MKHTFLLLIILHSAFSLKLFPQKEIDVSDQTIKIGGFKEEELLFGFAEGDKIIFNFQEKNEKKTGKPLLLFKNK